MDGQRETPRTQVGASPTQVRDIRDRWSWVEPCVWTERMLTALENGVKGGKWFSLVDKVYSKTHLRKAFERVKANGGAAGVDFQTVEMFEANLEENLTRLSESLKDGTYRPQGIRRAWIPKPGSKEERPLGIPTVRDRVVQTALRNVLEPIFERDAAAHSYGARPGRGCKDALRRVVRLLDAGYHWVVDVDVKSYFDTIPHRPLLGRVAAKVSDGRILELVEAYLTARVMETAEGWTPEQGTPQGAVISPLLANLYLDPLDHLMAEWGFEMIRYMDDSVILCRTQAEAERALEKVQEWMAHAGLTLHPDKTRIVDATQRGGFDFLGYHFERGYRWPRPKSLTKFKDAIRSVTRRKNGHSLEHIITQVNQRLDGWFEYFKHSHWTTFDPLDAWIRMRLRTILRRRRRRLGQGRGHDHFRWPNAYFAQRGLHSLVAAHAQACQSSPR